MNWENKRRGRSISHGPVRGRRDMMAYGPYVDIRRNNEVRWKDIKGLKPKKKREHDPKRETKYVKNIQHSTMGSSWKSKNIWVPKQKIEGGLITKGRRTRHKTGVEDRNEILVAEPKGDWERTKSANDGSAIKCQNRFAMLFEEEESWQMILVSPEKGIVIKGRELGSCRSMPTVMEKCKEKI